MTIKKTIDGNEAAALISYPFTEVAAIYPITPSSPMAEHVDEWAASGKRNIFGQSVKLVEMQSEAGAIGTMHGSLEAGTLTTSYTASQGLLLMIPTMYRLSGQLKPGVLHVSARTVGTNAFSIFGDHSDVMATRQTGFAMISSSNVQEAMDLGALSHLSSIKSSVPFLHFFDGFRTSHEIQKIDCLEDKEVEKLIDFEAVERFRKKSLNPERPVLRSTAINPDLFFQSREASNIFYDRIPEIVENYMEKINKITGRNYKLFNYYGAEDAEYIVIAMGSVSGAIEETVDKLNREGNKVGFLKVHLYRPFSIDHFLKELPDNVKKITVLDRTKEPGATGEPLYLDVCSDYIDKKQSPKILGGRYGLSSKDVDPGQILSIFNNMMKENSKNHFTVGINDDVTNLSLPIEKLDIIHDDIVECKFWGYGSDGTVGANKNSVKIIGDNTDKYVQAYFEYDTKKSGGVTKSHLRFGDSPIKSSYYIKNADFVACHKPSYLDKYDMLHDLKEGGIFLLNCEWDENEIDEKLPDKIKKDMSKKNIKFYTIDATNIAKEIGLGNRINTILQSAFFKLAKIISIEEAVKHMKDAILKSYGNKGDKVVNMNYKAVDFGIEKLKKVEVKNSWSEIENIKQDKNKNLPKFVKEILIPSNSQYGDEVPVSAFIGREDGTFPLGTSKYEKRGIAVDVPVWNEDNCIQCNMCSFVCPHAAIRPFLLSKDESENAPDSYKTIQGKGKNLEKYRYRIQVDPLDCTGCGTCVEACPSKEKALLMDSLESQIKEFSGACAGCGETAYMKTLTQLFGDRMYIANATGCTQAWGAALPCIPYVKNADGLGPAWSNSLFENNAEFSLGMALSVKQQRNRLALKLEKLIDLVSDELKQAISKWLNEIDNKTESKEISQNLFKKLNEAELTGEAKKLKDYIINNKEHLVKKSMWMYGGDGWAYDIGYGGLDHVLASGEDLNIMLVDTEVYSNTGGQSSKATPVGAVAKFDSSGKTTGKKDLGMLAMTYENIYVAQVSLGANQNQLMKAIKEAEEYNGPSLIIAYAPCINHGLVKGMGYSTKEGKLAVETGYWNLYRYNPNKLREGNNPFTLDSKEPTKDLKEFLDNEVRFTSLKKTNPENYNDLIEEARKEVVERYKKYKKIEESFDI
jgi:pyruvate-ferredoxin/flavodoxin oxidoreductase